MPYAFMHVDQLRDECKDVEKTYLNKYQPPIVTRKESPSNTVNRFSAPRRTYPVNEVNYLEEKDDEIPDDVAELLEEISNQSKANTKNSNKLICWNCQKSGHSFIDCLSTQRGIFCYRCGMQGVVAPECPKCLENSKRSVKKPGESRSTQTPRD